MKNSLLFLSTLFVMFVTTTLSAQTPDEQRKAREEYLKAHPEDRNKQVDPTSTPISTKSTNPTGVSGNAGTTGKPGNLENDMVKPGAGDKKMGGGPAAFKCCDRMKFRRPGASADATSTVLAENLLAGKNAEGMDIKFELLDANMKAVPAKLWKVSEDTAGDMVLDASNVPAPPKGKKLMLRVRYAKKYQDYPIQ